VELDSTILGAVISYKNVPSVVRRYRLQGWLEFGNDIARTKFNGPLTGSSLLTTVENTSMVLSQRIWTHNYRDFVKRANNVALRCGGVVTLIAKKLVHFPRQ
jgi:hypothetical protein